jgi:ATP adenylyltransferase
MQIYAPERKMYNKEVKLKKACYFCDKKVIREQICSRFSFEYWNVLTNKYPYMDGNVMLIPKNHLERLEDISEDIWKEFPVALLEVQKVLGKIFTTESFNIGINIGKESGRSVEHLHWQIIPRKEKNHTVVGVLADIHVITLSPEDLKKKLSER